MHWTKIDFSLGIDRVVFLRGFTLSVGGAAEGFVSVDTPDGARVFGGPLVEERLTECPDPAIVHMFALPVRMRVDFPERLLVSSLTLWHQSTNNEPYTVQDLRPHYYTGMDNLDMIDLARPRPRHRYWPSRLAHTTLHN